MSISIAVLVSGTGSNLKAILEAVKQGRVDAAVSVVISNKPEAKALQVAAEYGVKAVAIASRGLSREDHEDLLITELSKHRVDYVVLAGYMRVLTGRFLNHFRHADGYFKVINIHPALLPAFPGMHGYEDAFAYGVKVSGITVHLLDEQVDHGPILAQEAFKRLDDDTLETFKARGLEVEHRLYPAVLQAIATYGLGGLITGKSHVAAQATSRSGSQ